MSQWGHKSSAGAGGEELQDAQVYQAAERGGGILTLPGLLPVPQQEDAEDL